MSFVCIRMEGHEVRERIGGILLNVNNICGHKIYGLHIASVLYERLFDSACL